MISFINKLDGRIIDQNDSIIDKSAFWDTERHIREIISDTSCSNHIKDSFATIIIIFGNGLIRWDFSDFCCDDFAKKIEGKLSQSMIRLEK
jgi:hypothetical protein